MRRIRFLAIVPLVACLAVASACGGDSLGLRSPTEPSASLLGLGRQQTTGFTLVDQPVLAGLGDFRVTHLIGSRGGQLSLLGATLTVPRGAVQRPTLFSLIALPTGHVEVELGASIHGLFGSLLDVGHGGFDQPVTLTLSYANATNVTDPSRLEIVYAPGLFGYDNLQSLPSTVDEEHQTVTARLPHFSRYLLASPN